MCASTPESLDDKNGDLSDAPGVCTLYHLNWIMKCGPDLSDVRHLSILILIFVVLRGSSCGVTNMGYRRAEHWEQNDVQVHRRGTCEIRE